MQIINWIAGKQLKNKALLLFNRVNTLSWAMFWKCSNTFCYTAQSSLSNLLDKETECGYDMHYCLWSVHGTWRSNLTMFKEWLHVFTVIWNMQSITWKVIEIHTRQWKYFEPHILKYELAPGTKRRNWLYLNKPQRCFLHIVIATPSLIGYIFLSVSFEKAKDICRTPFAICSYKLLMGVQKRSILFHDICTYSLLSDRWSPVLDLQFLFQNIIWDQLEYILRIYSNNWHWC